MLQSITLFGRSIDLFGLFNNSALLGQIIVVFFLREKAAEASTLPKLANMYLNKKRKDTLLWRWGFLVVFAVIFVSIISAVNSLSVVPISKLFLGTSVANFFPDIFVCPITVVLLSVLLRNAPLKSLDIAAMLTAVSLIFYKLACFCQGCCNGVAWEYGMMNHDTGRKEFPIQLVEIVCAVVMLVILIVLLRKKSLRHGMLYPIFMLMYCGSRFISEFWRDDFPAVWGPLKGYHIQCILGFVEGAIFLFIVLKWGDRITAYFEAKNQAFLDRN